MSDAFLIICQPGMDVREQAISSGAAVSIGRALDNSICLADDPKISRYHAVIEARGDDFYLSDLGSSNGTQVNEQAVTCERKLQHGETIVLGGSTLIEFRTLAPQSAAPAARPDAPQPEPIPAEAVTASARPNAAPATSKATIILIAGACVGLGLLIAAGVLYTSGVIGGGCSPVVRIVSPQSGTAVRGAVRIRVESEQAKCIERVVYQLDGSEVASADAAPYHVALTPNDLDGIPGGNHLLTVVVEDTAGKKRLQPGEVLLAFENARAAASEPTPGVANNAALPAVTVAPLAAGAVDVPGLSIRLASQISRKSGYNFDAKFAAAIAARVADYRQSGYTDRARQVRRDVNKAYRDRGLEPLVGYVLAMSRSKLNANAGGEGVGLWQISPTVAQGFLAPGESAATALADPKRSAEVSALYVKALIDVFEMDDFMYAVACFGLPLGQAGDLRTKLVSQAPDPATRRDFSRMVELGVVTREQADRVASFFAAGIVGENPRAFGLQSEAPFSSLY